MKKHSAKWLLLFGAAAFAVGMFELFKLRFEAGDMYPPYSSLRADPLGTMALFESLGRLPGVTVTRDFSSVDTLPDGRGSTYLHLAATREEWMGIPEEAIQEIKNYVLSGGRLVIAFLPETSRAFPSIRRGFAGRTPPPAPKPGAKTAASGLFQDRWGVEFGFQPLQSGEAGAYKPVRVENRTGQALPDSLDWHSGMTFTNLNPAWSIIYSRGKNPVMIERNFGPGSVVLMSDCFCLSNEAMVADRQPRLLAWLMGTANSIQFDEAHLGLVESPGVSTLLRQYRLGGLVLGLVLVVILFIWQHSTSFLPGIDHGQAQDELAGREAAAGLVNLLRRNIAPSALLRVCFDQWTKSLARTGAHSIARVDEAQAVFKAEVSQVKSSRDPVQAYRQIRRALKGPEHRAEPRTQ
jgi:hypothetical protein